MDEWQVRALGNRDMGSRLDDDTQLVRRVASGDEEAVGLLYDHLGRSVYSLCLRIVRDAGAAEELTQETFVRLWRSADSFDVERGRVSTWLLRIAHNLALNEIRRRQIRPIAAPQAEWETTVATLADSSLGADPPTVAALRERAEAVRSVLAELPDPQRKVIELAFFGGLSQAEVAAALGDPLGTVNYPRLKPGACESPGMTKRPRVAD